MSEKETAIWKVGVGKSSHDRDNPLYSLSIICLELYIPNVSLTIDFYMPVAAPLSARL